MKKIVIAMSLVVLIGASVAATLLTRSQWAGVDETVVEKVAEEGGRPAREPFINTDQGDLLLFVFLVAGAVGGFVGGYFFRGLFPPREQAAGNGAS